MKIKRSNSMFESSRRRGGPRLPVIRLALAILVLAILVLAWQRGGERPVTPVEKPIPAEKLGQ
ncbi:hypothetical protein GCM10007897_10920 [Sphingobium jiangsuense]|uniref:Uncharacterized protein n=1 Tax=Sphingobium jiangsuense TaxID=870476 RepID=A0A7W6BJU7_9SPHN|nr:hypothetical protein [Sphingobium jiangsuense]MBB3926327.1 hypothetical protein [Sphingobium jiangsuense]GLS99709.1 hypothetical protein GCM10007897_10920 [Sphingobium jiangsuense]